MKEDRTYDVVKLTASLMAISFLLGLAGYWPAELDWIGISDAVYKTISLFFVSYFDDGRLYPLIHVARLLCPLSLCAFAISWVTTRLDHLWLEFCSLSRRVKLGPLTFGRDAVAIYGSGEIAAQAAEGTHFIQAGSYFLKNAKHHIILMENDEASFLFRDQHEAALRRGNTYIGLQQISSFLIQGIPHVSYFNVKEEAAREYWKRNSIREQLASRPHLRIVILGCKQDNLGCQLLRYGLMNNLFREDQRITYDIFCQPEDAYRGFELLNPMNHDQINWHTTPWQLCQDPIVHADRIILCQEIDPKILNELLLICTDQQIDYYDPLSVSYPQKYAYPHLRAFGCTREILNEDTILKGKLYQAAMERHYQYIAQNGTEEEREQIRTAELRHQESALRQEMWNQLSGFLKNSNAACSDYYEIYPVSPGLSDALLEERAKLEHIRWCRFHFLCGWQYGEPAAGRKDSVARLHRDLVPWEDLGEAEREKDRQQVGLECSAALPS